MATITSSIVNGTAWAGSTAYSVDDRRTNDSTPTKLYICTSAGTSASSGGPTGTGTGISDGTCTWDYVTDVDYTTINGWDADLAGSSGGAGNDAVGELYNEDWFTLESGVDDATPDSIRLTVASGERHDGTRGTGAGMQRTGGADNFATGTSGPIIEYVEMDGNSVATGQHCHSAATGTITRQCLIYDADPTDASDIGVAYSGSQTRIFNCIVINCGSGLGGSVGTGASYVRVCNNTVYGCTDTGAYGIYNSHDAANRYFANNICMANDTDFSGAGYTNGTIKNNLSDDATAPGTDSHASETASSIFTDTTSGAEILTLQASTNAVDGGADLYSAIGDGVEVDAIGRNRQTEGDTWDIGALELVSAGGGATLSVKLAASGGLAGRGGLAGKGGGLAA